MLRAWTVALGAFTDANITLLVVFTFWLGLNKLRFVVSLPLNESSEVTFAISLVAPITKLFVVRLASDIVPVTFPLKVYG